MKLLNVGCGGNRPQDPHWWNIDCLRNILALGTPERMHLDAEPRYIDHDLREGLPFGNDLFDALLISHVVEHFSAHGAAALLGDCRRILKPGGLLVVSVPDAEYFLKVYDRDTPENAVELFGEPISESWQKSFFDYALFKNDHMQVLTLGSLQCLLIKAGFRTEDIRHYSSALSNSDVESEIGKIMNRRKFSVELAAIK